MDSYMYPRKQRGELKLWKVHQLPIRHGKRACLSVRAVMFFHFVLSVHLSTNPGVFAQDASSAAKISSSTSGQWIISPTTIDGTLRPSPTVISMTASTGTTPPLTKTPDIGQRSVLPTQTLLPMVLAVTSAGQIMPSSSGMVSDKTTDSLHTTNALPNSAVRVNSIQSFNVITAFTTTVVASTTTTRRSMFFSHLDIVSTAAVTPHLQSTNFVLPILLSSAADNTTAFNAMNIFTPSSIHTNNINTVFASGSYAINSLLQLTKHTSLAKEASILQTTHSVLQNSATFSTFQSNYFQTSFVAFILASDHVNSVSSHLGALEQITLTPSSPSDSLVTTTPVRLELINIASVPASLFTQIEQTTVSIELFEGVSSSLSDIGAITPVSSIPYTYVSKSVATPTEVGPTGPTTSYVQDKQTTVHTLSSKHVSSGFLYSSENIASAAKFRTELIDVTTLPTSQAEQTTALDPSLLSIINQYVSNSNIFSNGAIESTAVQSYIEYSTVLQTVSATPPLYITFYTPYSDVSFSNVLEAEQMYSTHDVYITSELVSTKNADYFFTMSIEPTVAQHTHPPSSLKSRNYKQTLYGEGVNLTSSVDLETIIETTTVVDSSVISEATPSIILINSLLDSQSSSRTVLLSLLTLQESSSTLLPSFHAAIVRTATVIDANSISTIPVPVTEFSTVTASLPSLDFLASNMNSALTNAYSSFVYTTVLKETKLYLSSQSLSAQFESVTPARSDISTNLTSTLFPGQPFPIPTQSISRLYQTKTRSLEPSPNVLSSVVFVTSTGYETTMLPLMSELISMRASLFPSSSLSTHLTESLPLLTKQLHASVLPSASSAVQYFLNTSSHSFQLPGLVDRLSRNVNEISSQYRLVSSSLANQTSVFFTPLLPPATTSLPRQSQQSASYLMSNVSFSETAGPLATNQIDSIIAIETTQTMIKTSSYIHVLPNILYSKSLELSLLPTPFILSSSLMSSVPIPSLTPSLIHSSLSPHLSAQSTSLFTVVLPTSSVSTMTSVMPGLPSLPPDVASSSDVPTPTTSLPLIITTKFPPKILTPSDMPVIMPTPTPVTRPTESSLDTSFVTKPYWVLFDISLVSLPSSFDVMSREFRGEMETNLARVYKTGKTEIEQRQKEIKALLKILDPENDPLLRKRRATTVNGITAQVIDISRTPTNSPDATLVFYMEDGGVKVPATDCIDIMNELDDTELTHYLGVVVTGGATVYLPDTAVPTTQSPGGGPTFPIWFIPVIVIIGLCLLFCCCCWFYCFCCRVPPSSRKQTDGPMDPETLKMLKFKSKYPYRTYDPTHKQTPRGFDVAKEGLGNSALSVEEEIKKVNGNVDSAKESPKRTLPKIPKQVDNIQHTKVESKSLDADISPYATSTRLPRDSSDTDNLLSTDTETSAKSTSRSVTPGISVKFSPKKLPKTNLSWKPKQNSEKMKMKQQKQQNARKGHYKEEDEFKKVYMEAQKEISKVLEPELYAGLEGAPPSKGKRRKSSRSKRINPPSSSGRKFETQFDNLVSGLPETHLSRKPISPNSTLDRQETMQDAKQRVHALIDEAFSLVTHGGSPKRNSVSPAPPTDKSDNAEKHQNAKARGRRHNQRPLVTSPPIREEEEPPLFEKTQHHQKVGHAEEPPTRVVIVPVSHIPDKAADRVMWGPYQAEDDISRITTSQQLQTSIPGMTPSPRTAVRSRPQPKSRSSTPGINQVLPPLTNLPNTSLQQPQQGNHEHQMPNIANKYSPDGASSESETVYFPEKQTRPHEGDQKRTRNPDANPALSRTNLYAPSPRSNRAPSETDLLSTIVKEQKLGKPIEDDYDELDMTGVLDSSAGKSHGLVTAVKEELMRLARKGEAGQDLNGYEIGPI